MGRPRDERRTPVTGRPGRCDLVSSPIATYHPPMGKRSCSRHALAALLAVAACGGQDAASGADASPADAAVGDDAAQACSAGQTIRFDFSLSGLAAGEREVSLTCATSERRDGDQIVVAFTACVGAGDQPHADLELRLIGEWPDPPLDDEPAVRVRYVEQVQGIQIDRWLVIESDGQFSLPLAAVAASGLSPAGAPGFGYGPIQLVLDSAGCEPADPGDGCGAIDRLQLSADYSGDSRVIVDGNRIDDLGSADGGDSTQFHVVVPRAVDRLDTSCTDLASRRIELGIVAYPVS